MPNEGGGLWLANDGSVFQLEVGGGTSMLHIRRVPQCNGDELTWIERVLEASNALVLHGRRVLQHGKDE